MFSCFFFLGDFTFSRNDILASLTPIISFSWPTFSFREAEWVDLGQVQHGPQRDKLTRTHTPRDNLVTNCSHPDGVSLLFTSESWQPYTQLYSVCHHFFASSFPPHPEPPPVKSATLFQRSLLHCVARSRLSDAEMMQKGKTEPHYKFVCVSVCVCLFSVCVCAQCRRAHRGSCQTVNSLSSPGVDAALTVVLDHLNKHDVYADTQVSGRSQNFPLKQVLALVSLKYGCAANG